MKTVYGPILPILGGGGEVHSVLAILFKQFCLQIWELGFKEVKSLFFYYFVRERFIFSREIF